MTIEETPQYAFGYSRGVAGEAATSNDPGYLTGHAAGWRVWLTVAATRLIGVLS